MIIACKIFLAEVFSDGGEASWLNINSFIESDKYVQLHAIFQIGLIQSEYLDKAMLENMHNQHLRNKAESLQSAIIVGAGPNGLYSAFKLFLLGINVTLVNDREEYIRNQLVNLDGNWMIHLSIWLGTKFDELFLEEESPGFVNETFADGGLINIKLLEIAMKQD
uniref:FAD-binding domain-containing protein n=1 Tax=Ditylenchus dipsaci TaxID=166011 RepID=A0A915D7Z9_9BILA